MTTKLYVRDNDDHDMPALREFVETLYVEPVNGNNDDDLMLAFNATHEKLLASDARLAELLNVREVLIDNDTIDYSDWMFIMFDANDTSIPLGFINWDVFGENEWVADK